MAKLDQLTRMLAILALAQNDTTVSVTELAKELGVSKAQILKDLETLWFCGLPGGFPGDLIEVDMEVARESGLVRLSNAEYLSKPLRLTRYEALSLQFALQVVGQFATGTQRQAVRSAQQKLASATGISDEPMVELRAGDDRVRAELFDAINTDKRLRLRYDSLSRGETISAEVDPADIELLDGVLYLQAFSLIAQDWRSYRLDRIQDVKVVGQAENHAGRSAARWLEPKFFVRLQLAPEASWVVEYYFGQEVEILADGVVNATFPVVSENWLTAILLRLGSQAKVIDSSDAKELAKSAAANAIAMYAKVR